MVYILKCRLRGGDEVIKIGVTKRKWVHTRLSEVLLDYFNAYKYIPETEVLVTECCKDDYHAESELHKLYRGSRYKFHRKFSGSSEFFIVRDYGKLIKDYREVLARQTGECTYNEIDDINESLVELGL